MTKSKHTKRALLASVLSVLLCLSMLVGSTFAWFTDSVTSGKNKIVAGNLDVELEYSTDAATWNPVKADTNLFHSTKWEPGHTEYVYLRVRNAGTLALKYQFSMNVFGDETGTQPEKQYTNVDGNLFKLSNYLVFRQIEGTTPPANREALWLDAAAEAADMGKLDGLGLTGELKATEQKTLTLAVYMPTQVGNVANQMTSKRTSEGEPTIFLGLNLVATQDAVESDSFGTDYDKKAWNALGFPTEVADAESLKTAIEEGGNIKLTKSITETYTTGDETNALAINTDTALDLGNNTFEIQSASGKNGVTVAEGKTATLSNGTITMDNSYGSGHPVVGAQKSNVTLNNMTVELTDCSAWEFSGPVCVSAGSDGGNVVINNSIIKGFTGIYSGAVYCGDWSTVVIKDSTIIGSIVAMSNGSIELHGGDYTNAVLHSLAKGAITVYSGTFKVDPSASGSYHKGCTIAEGSTVINNGDGTWTVTAG